MTDYLTFWQWENEDVDEKLEEQYLPQKNSVYRDNQRKQHILKIIRLSQKPLTVETIHNQGFCLLYSETLAYLEQLEKKEKVTRVKGDKFILCEPEKAKPRLKKKKRKKHYKNQRGKLISDGIKKVKRRRKNSSWHEYYYCYRNLDQTKKSIYIPLKLLPKIKEMESQKMSILEILEVLKSKV